MIRSFLVLFLLATSACQPTLATRGNLVDPDDLALLTVGKSGREDVRTILGTPTSAATMDDNIWYYIGQNTEREGFRREEVTQRRIIALTFDEAGTLASIKPIDNSGREVEMVERITPTTGHNLTVFQQVFGNLGRFNSEDKQTGPAGAAPGQND